MKDLKLSELHKIVNKQIIANDVKRIEVTAETISRKVKPGQFVIVMPTAKSERIPLSVVDCDVKRGIITLIFQEVGAATKELGALSIGDSLFTLLGPLGMPAVIQNAGVVACVGYGIGIAPLLSMSKAYRKLENKVIGVIGAKTKRSLILEPQMRLSCHKLYVTTDDGSYERRGLVINILPDVIKKEGVALICASGPIDMLESISAITRQMKIKTVVHLNPVMLDGTGMCGSCRVKVGAKDFLACVDGPQFDGHAVDYKDLMLRTSR